MMAVMLSWCVLGQSNLALVADVGETLPEVAKLKSALEQASFITTHISNASRNQIDEWRAQNLSGPVKSLVLYLKMPTRDNDATLPRFWPYGASDDDVSATSFDLVTLVAELSSAPIENLVVVTEGCLPGDIQRLSAKIHTDRSVLVITRDDHRNCTPSADLATAVIEVLAASQRRCGASVIEAFYGLAQRTTVGLFSVGPFESFCVEPRPKKIEEPTQWKKISLVTGPAGALLAVGGGLLLRKGLNTRSANQAKCQPPPPLDESRYRECEKIAEAHYLDQGAGIFMLALGAAVALASGVCLVGCEDAPQVQVQVGAQFIGISGSF